MNEATGLYVHRDSTVNLSVGPVACAISTDRPLPSQAWESVGKLAAACEACARDIQRFLAAYQGDDEPQELES